MERNIFEIKNLNDLEIVASKLWKKYSAETIFILNGEMGVGKTTFTKLLCKTINVIDDVNSPTFSIVNEYETDKGNTIFHMDCYRIKNIQEAQEIGIEDYLESGKVCLIEWAENIAPLLPEHYIEINIVEVKNGMRKMEIKKV